MVLAQTNYILGENSDAFMAALKERHFGMVIQRICHCRFLMKIRGIPTTTFVFRGFRGFRGWRPARCLAGLYCSCTTYIPSASSKWQRGARETLKNNVLILFAKYSVAWCNILTTYTDVWQLLCTRSFLIYY